MTVAYLGSMTIGVAVLGGFDAATAGQLGIEGALPDLQARIAALAAFNPQPIDYSVSLSIANSIIAGINASITLGIVPPDFSAQIAIVLGIVTDLEAIALDVDAKLTVVVDFLGLLATAGVHLYKYSGNADQLGPEFTTELSGGFPGGSGGSESCNALVLATTNGATWTAMQGVFKTT